MHFAKCTQPNVLRGCPQKSHGHLWADHGERQDLVIMPDMPDMTTKTLARETVESFLKVFIVDPVLSQKWKDQIVAEINATDLPEDDLPVWPRPHSHLRRIK